MVFIGSRDGLAPSSLAPPFERTDTGYVSQSSNTDSIISEGDLGAKIERKIMRWKTPNLGWVKMYVNPQNYNISERKDIESTRTKAGFILQYAGEALTEIAISGTTAASGIEGINVLRAVYRAEQIAFKSIASELERAGPTAEAIQLSQGFIGDFQGDGAGFVGGSLSLFNELTQVSLNVFNQPFPTLASLAANVELYFHGELFRGYFKDFKVSEKAESPGLFNYDINFTAHSRQGIRRNFMPWHRQPFNPASLEGDNANPLSFNNGGFSRRAPEEYPQQTSFPPGTFPPTNVTQPPLPEFKTNRDTNSGSGSRGSSLQRLDLTDFA